MLRMFDSLSSSFGVVPEEISAWKPEMAPQAMVMNTNGNNVPAKTRPVPSMNFVIFGMCNSGATQMTATAKTATVPIFMKVLR